ncbi:hypothetical protein [Halobacterium litoreum]|uniref:TIGR04206 family protein n=1 Tax=Halobacterium litoreum TaxID=2039234 RepID=A0ABD5NEI4_9EURY|nr:hypothetical protein [Halobacterium litoreum]UHH13450.1 hypothetical protein LT972_00290 [Halobacterium litoreum]
MNRRVAVVFAVLVGAAFAAATYVGLWRSYELAFGVFVAYSFGAWAFADVYDDWPEDEHNWVQAAFPAFATLPALIGLPATIPVARRAALGVLVFGAAYGGIFLGMAWTLRATR